MTTEAASVGGWTVGRAGLIGVASCSAAMLVSLAMTQGPMATGVMAGAVASGIGGLIGLVLVGRVKGEGTNPLLAALVMAFLARLVLVGVGLVFTIKVANGDPFGFVFAFFPLFLVFVLLEGLVAGAQLKAARAAKS